MITEAAVTLVPSAAPLDAVLGSRRWDWFNEPFPHVTAHDVFVPAFYRQLEAQVFDLWRADRFARNMAGYDAFGYTVTSSDAGPLALFHSRPWHDMVAAIFGVAATGDVNISLHHHRPDSRSGEVHNDLNPGCFVDEGRLDGITTADPARCGYWRGQGAVGPVEHRVRAVALLLYVSNPAWRPGQGGETGLYCSVSDSVHDPARRVPPVNNSLVAFECTTDSYHSFLANLRPRTSLIMWLHRDRQDAIERFGEDRLVPWD